MEDMKEATNIEDGEMRRTLQVGIIHGIPMKSYQLLTEAAGDVVVFVSVEFHMVKVTLRSQSRDDNRARMHCIGVNFYCQFRNI